MPAMLDPPFPQSPVDLGRLQADFARIDEEQQAILRSSRETLAFALDTPQRLQALWKQFPRDDVQKLHAQRDVWFHCIDLAIEEIRSTILIMSHAAKLAGAPLAGSERLESVLKEVEAYREIFDERWQTLEDVDYMIRCERFSLSEQQLQELVRKYPPPQSWYEEPDWQQN